MNSSVDGQNEGGIVIEKGVPVPPCRDKGRWQNLLSEMAVGDSFLATEKESHSFQKAARKNGDKVTVRMTKEDNIRPIRVWLAEKKEATNE
jgi:uncharacterized membrane-anchored protein